MNFRINAYVTQLTEFESLRTKVVSLEQMLSNGTAQREELKEELQVAIQRANIVGFLTFLSKVYIV
jgi:hypothetical protein